MAEALPRPLSASPRVGGDMLGGGVAAATGAPSDGALAHRDLQPVPAAGREPGAERDGFLPSNRAEPPDV
eukprot:62015-Pyramimonas_sp.AAC.1